MKSPGEDPFRSALPDFEGTVHVHGLSAIVDIWRDDLGIPHVQAGSEADAFFGQGFVHAQDRLFHMDLDRHRARGRAAELIGKSALDQDRLWRRFSLGEGLEAEYAALPNDVQAMFAAYAAGVNACMASLETMPVEYTLLGVRPEPWQPWDGMAVYKGRHILMGVFQRKLWRQEVLHELGADVLLTLMQPEQEGELLMLPPGTALAPGKMSGAALRQLFREAGCAEDEGGSNNWVLAGARTASGKPLMAGDPHRGVEVPNVYYQNHIACDTFDVVGLSFPGLPGFPHFGHNARVAWCITHTGADTQDLFRERFDTGDGLRYRFQGQWRPASVRQERLRVRGGDEEIIDVVSTHHGPVIAGNPRSGEALSLRYTATAEPFSGWTCLLRMLHAESAQEFSDAMQGWVVPVNNLLIADVDGTIGYRTRGKLPLRDRRNAVAPMPGWTGEHEWTGTVAFGEMPSLWNPEPGFIATANNRVISPDYPHHVSLEFSADNRAQRLVARIEALKDARAADMARIHADIESVPAKALLQLLPFLAPQSPAGLAAKDVLASWDGRMEMDSAAPTIYAEVREVLLERVLQGKLGSLYALTERADNAGGLAMVSRLRQRIMQLAAADDRGLLPAGHDWPGLLSECLDTAAARLQEALGHDTNAWSWGSVHRLKAVHPLATVLADAAHRLNPPEVALPGGPDTVRAASYMRPSGYTVLSSSVARYVFDLGDWEQSGWIVPLGSSGHPASPHFADQQQDWAECRLQPMRYDWQRIKAEAGAHQTLRPV